MTRNGARACTGTVSRSPPTSSDIAQLSRAYTDALAPGARESIFRLRDAGLCLALVSGGIRQAIRPLARELGFSDGSLHAVSVSFDDAGQFVGYDEKSPLATHHGKRDVVAALASSTAVARRSGWGDRQR